MRNSNLFFTAVVTASLCLFGMSMKSASALAEEAPRLIDSSFHTGYIPDGFDTNDSVELVGEGLFRSSCYKPANVEVNVDTQAKRIELNPKAYFYDTFCLQMMIPYHQVINLGILPFGRYTVVDPSRKLELGELNIRLATSDSADDFLYAPVSQAYFKTENGRTYVTISGTFTNSCMRLAEMRIDVQPRVVTIQPVMEMQQQTEACAEGMFPFERRTEVSGVHRGQRYLLHVRSLNGKSINNLVDVE